MRRTTLWTLAAALTLGLAVLAATPPANLPQALEAQRRLVADHPTDAAAANDLGNLLVLAGDAEAAQDAYRRAIELAPDESAYHYNLALLLQQLDRPHRALDEFRRVVELDPTNAWATYQIGALLERQGRRRAAIEWYGRAFRLNHDLAFPDVNPHVIDSELTAEAMLRGYQPGLVDPPAPRIYEEPGRISALLVTPPAATPPNAVAAAPPADAPVAEPVVGRETGRGGIGQARPPAGGTAVADEPQPRVLTEEDLLIGPLNQAAPPDAAPARPTRRGGTTVVVPGTVAAPPAADRNAPRRPTTPRDREIVPDDGAPFRPGLPSTGRLDTLLLDETERRG